ncbi:Gfo/Idh/MocA family oxidoreductase [Natronoglomus mannanivorans]|uniref:Gfo/Idh/MocA family oxidoreductase n=1 Tax=Natronoglomus mannanivorans TaxID=2979990 RepID=A0AAP3E0Y0_9EURY|nr:Gfo/Idh/MocA family oxidoreductase [Halobacteria archaeon AArc-xg1-1]
MTDPIRYGIVGVSGYGSTHADCVEAIEGVELVAGAATSRSSLEPFEAERGATGYTDHVEMLEGEDLDAVSVCTPSGTHAEITIDAARAGVHPLVEKPLDVRIDRVDRMIEVADECGVRLGGVFQRRFTPERWTARQWVDEGRFGDMILADTAVKYHRSQEYYDGWHGTRDLDGGVLLQQASHFVDLLQWLTGGIERVDATTDTLAHEMECEDVAVVTVEFENGAYGSIEATTAVQGATRERVELNGTDGSYSSGTFALDGEEVDPDLEEPPCGTGLEGQIRDFVAAVREDRPPLVDGREARDAVEVVLAAYASASLDRAVRVDEVREFAAHT